MGRLLSSPLGNASQIDPVPLQAELQPVLVAGEKTIDRAFAVCRDFFNTSLPVSSPRASSGPSP
jgi:hypothetical protein